METEIVNIDINNIDEEKIKYCGNIIKSGGLVAFPTESVYGLGADAFNSKAVKKIFKAKGRPNDNPIIVHIANNEDILKITPEITPQIKEYMNNFWPGALTLIVKKHKDIPQETSAYLNTIGVRQPSHPIANALIKSCGPIAAPSANLSGKPSPTSASHVLNDLKGKVNCIIDSGVSTFGIESTVIDMYTNTIVRLGAVSQSKLIPFGVGIYSLDMEQNLVDKPIAPGQKYKHYAPNAHVTLFYGEKDLVTKTIKNRIIACKPHTSIGVLLTNDTLHSYKGLPCITLSLGDFNKPLQLSQNLYACLRKFNDLNVTHIFIEGFLQTHDLYLSIMERLLKASSYNVVFCDYIPK